MSALWLPRGTANASLFAGAQYGYLPELFACIHRQRLTPLPGVVLKGFLAIIFCIPTNIYGLIDFFSFGAWMFHSLTFVATLCCKFTKKDTERVINIPIPLIVIIILISIYLVTIPVITSPNIEFLITSCWILFGLIFYYLFVYRKRELQFM
ncbi:unnamed protein product, partial [Rotaria sordida]